MNPSKLATKIAKESSGVSIRVGRTNGLPVLHLARKRDDDRSVSAASVTIPAEVTAWNLHPWNKFNKPKETKNT